MTLQGGKLRGMSVPLVHSGSTAAAAPPAAGRAPHETFSAVAFNSSSCPEAAYAQRAYVASSSGAAVHTAEHSRRNRQRARALATYPPDPKEGTGRGSIFASIEYLLRYHC